MPELAALPWEFLYDPSEGDYLCLSTPVVRYLDVPQLRRPLIVTPPLRILTMIAYSDQLDADHERRRLTEALADLEAARRVQLTWAQGQTWWDLQKALDRGEWHIFHFIGHGALDTQTGEGVVALAAEDGGVHRLGANDFARPLAEHSSLRLVVLNSCETARADAADRFSSTASVLMRRGIPAVVAMQYEITDPAAIAFARGFYTALAHQLPVDRAVTRGRRAIKNSQANTLEWATPVLFLRSPTGYLFDLTDIRVRPASSPAPGITPPDHEAATARQECATGLHTPTGISFDATGNLLICNRASDEIMRVTPEGAVSRVADGLSTPVGVVEDFDGTIYVANYVGGVLSRIDRDGRVERFSDNFEGLGVGMAVHHSYGLFVTDRAAGQIKRVERDGSAVPVMSGLDSPVALAIDHEGALHTATWGDGALHRVRGN